MSIEPVNGDQSLYTERAKDTIEKKYYEEYTSENEEKIANKRTDTLEVSEEARRLQAYRSKINEGFYNKPETIIDTASKIDSEIPPLSKAAE